MKIAIIMPFYFGYEKVIKKRLEKNNHQVYLINDNWDELSIINHIQNVYFKQDANLKKNRYYLEEINKIPSNLDCIMIITGRSISIQIMKRLKERFSNAQFIMYQWDCISQARQAEYIAKYCDRNITFDIRDAKDLGWEYRPLFFDDSNIKNDEKIYDFSYICSMHSERYILYNKLKKMCKLKKLKLFEHMYCEFGRYINQRYIKRNSDFYVNRQSLKFRKLSLNETMNVYNKTKCLVDYKYPAQTGFTMRTIESIGYKTKLVTNNKEIVKYDFYNPNNIYVYDLDNFVIPDDFINSPYQELGDSIYEKYSINGWLKDILGENIVR